MAVRISPDERLNLNDIRNVNVQNRGGDVEEEGYGDDFVNNLRTVAKIQKTRNQIAGEERTKRKKTSPFASSTIDLLRQRDTGGNTDEREALMEMTGMSEWDAGNTIATNAYFALQTRPFAGFVEALRDAVRSIGTQNAGTLYDEDYIAGAEEESPYPKAPNAQLSPDAKKTLAGMTERQKDAIARQLRSRGYDVTGDDLELIWNNIDLELPWVKGNAKTYSSPYLRRLKRETNIQPIAETYKGAQ